MYGFGIKLGYPRIDLFRSGDFCFLGVVIMKQRLIAVLTAIFCCGIAFADQKAEMALDTIVVTAQKPDKIVRTGDVNQEEIPVFSSVIQRESYEGRMESLSEVVEKEAGVQVRQSGGLGSFSTMSLRGASADQVMIFMDGIPLNDASGGSVDLSNISLSDVEAIEIYRGTTPLNFGRASLGGAVNIRTLRIPEKFQTGASVGYGSYDTRKFSAFASHKPSEWDYLIAADYLHSDNDFNMLNDNGTQWNDSDDRWEKRRNAQFDQHNVLGKLGYEIAEHTRLDIVSQWFDKSQGLPAWNNSSWVNTSLDTKRDISSLTLTADNLTSMKLNTRTRLDYSWKQEEYEDRGGHIGLGEQHNRYVTGRFGANFFVEWLNEHHILQANLDAGYETYEPEDLLKRSTRHDSSRVTYAMGIQDNVILFAGKLMITPGIRYLLIQDSLNSAESAWGIHLEEINDSKESFSPQIGIKYQAAEWLVFKANAAKYFREPSFFEMFGDRGFFIGNPDLKPETGVNTDVGAEIRYQMQNKWMQRICLNLVRFENKADDLITRVYDARGIGKSANIAKAEIDGIEAGLNVEFLSNFRFSLNATWQDTENRSGIKAFDGKQLPGRFDAAYRGRVEAEYHPIKLWAEYIRESGMYYDSANLLKADAKNEVNIGASWLFKSFLFNLEAKNIGDDRYEDFNGYPVPGRAWYFNVQYKY